ncbi:hypothetical protein [Brevibacillus sp. MS2.2]|uniref:hypothetical protein n=1 Tax=Brevibacillus sp. MS2.2 TaxID=2738981 RepID=UPI00156B6170|nr:hypothetical protein [Brevibacillus sp. MS2.2]NRR21423.1 hypothetical protein [Brevibacillus sp. MS2.2]
MNKKSRLFSVAMATIIGASLVTSGGLQANAKTDQNIGNIQGGYYYIDGIEYKVPNSEIYNFVNENRITNLPYVTSNTSTTSYRGDARKVRPTAGCDQGEWVFTAKRTASGFKLGDSGTRVINKTSRDLTETSKLSSSTTISGKVTGSGKWNWGVIEATAGFEIGGSITWTTEESTTITVGPGEWGWIDYGAYTETWEGDHYYVTPTCKIQDKKRIKVIGPKHKAKLARTEKF